MAERPRKQITLTDPRTMRALSHPARVAVIDALYGGRVATSTELAELTGLTPSAMSYHLRAMEKLGIVERAEASGDGRERPWRAAGEGITFSTLDTTAHRAAAALLTGRVMEAQRQALEEYYVTEPDLPPDWQGNAHVNFDILQLTAEETRELVDTLSEIGETFYRRSRDRDDRPGTRRVRLAITVVPATD